MVEQVGSVFVECAHGHLHAPLFADLLVRDPLTHRPLGSVNPGLLQVLSTIPQSYPGHSLLSEESRRAAGEDNCPCGRLGRYFHVSGRQQGAEVRDAATLSSDPVRCRRCHLASGARGRFRGSRQRLARFCHWPVAKLCARHLRLCGCALCTSAEGGAREPDLPAFGFWLRPRQIEVQRKRTAGRAPLGDGFSSGSLPRADRRVLLLDHGAADGQWIRGNVSHRASTRCKRPC